MEASMLWTLSDADGAGREAAREGRQTVADGASRGGGHAIGGSLRGRVNIVGQAFVPITRSQFLANLFNNLPSVARRDLSSIECRGPSLDFGGPCIVVEVHLRIVPAIAGEHLRRGMH